MAIAEVRISDLYGNAGRSPTLSESATPGATRPGADESGEGGVPPELAGAFATIAMSKPIYGLAVLAGMVVLLGVVARRFGTVEEFRDIRLSVYNILIISLAAIIGINFWKLVFTRIPVPHVTPVVLAT